MFWRDWYLLVWGERGTVLPNMSECIFTCTLCGKGHLSTTFSGGIATFPTTCTTARNNKGEYYILCADHEEAKAKTKKPNRPDYDHERQGDQTNLQGQKI